LFKPAAVILREAYAEMPIALRVVGRYDDIGAFASDLSRMPRIVTLHNLNLQVLEARPPAATGAPGTLILEAVIKTFRLLEDDEQSAQQRALEKRRTDTAGPT
jgi:type IV pilus assembly protein PilO